MMLNRLHTSLQTCHCNRPHTVQLDKRLDKQCKSLLKSRYIHPGTALLGMRLSRKYTPLLTYRYSHSGTAQLDMT